MNRCWRIKQTVVTQELKFDYWFGEYKLEMTVLLSSGEDDGLVFVSYPFVLSLLEQITHMERL